MLDIYGRRVSLMNYLGRSVLLSFHRAAVCPLCNLRMWHMIRRYPAYQRAGLEVIAFFESTPERARFYLDRQQAPFPIIADHDNSVYGDYRLGSSLPSVVWAFLTRRGMYRDAARLKIGGSTADTFSRSDGPIGRLPGDFLVGQDGRIRLAYYGRDPGDFILFSDLERAAFGAPLPDVAMGLPLGVRY